MMSLVTMSTSAEFLLRFHIGSRNLQIHPEEFAIFFLSESFNRIMIGTPLVLTLQLRSNKPGVLTCKEYLGLKGVYNPECICSKNIPITHIGWLLPNGARVC